MTDHPDDPEQPLDPFPTDFPEPPPSRFPPETETARPELPPTSSASDTPGDWIAAADPHDLVTEDVPPNRWKRLGRLAFPPPPPADEATLAARDRRWTTRAIVVIAVFMAVFNATSVQNWARQQPPNWFTVTVQQVADVWVAQITQLGADKPRQGIRDAYRAAHEARFPGQEEP